jgi:hypothetical protein
MEFDLTPFPISPITRKTHHPLQLFQTLPAHNPFSGSDYIWQKQPGCQISVTKSEPPGTRIQLTQFRQIISRIFTPHIPLANDNSSIFGEKFTIPVLTLK